MPKNCDGHGHVLKIKKILDVAFFSFTKCLNKVYTVDLGISWLGVNTYVWSVRLGCFLFFLKLHAYFYPMIRKVTNDSNSENSEDDYKICVNRPKRSINYEKFDYEKLSPDLLKHLDEDSESEDEEFVPKDEEDADDDDDDNDETSSENESNDESSETSQSKTETNNKANEEHFENGHDHLNGHSSKNKKANFNTTQKQKKIKKEEQSDVNANNKTKRAKAKAKQKNKAKVKPYEVDDDTQKLINSFRTAKIITKSKLKTPKVEPTPVTTTPATISKSGSLVPPRDKTEPITDFDSPWLCSLCSNPASFKPGVGDLFGPYRVRLNIEDNQLNG